MMNESIKNAIIKHLEKKNVITEGFYNELFEDVETFRSLSENVNINLLELKKIIIKTNLHLLIDKIFKEDKQGAINILKNTTDLSSFFDFTDAFGKSLILFEKYLKYLSFDSPDLSELKETFALKDEQLYELINEINLDKK